MRPYLARPISAEQLALEFARAWDRLPPRLCHLRPVIAFSERLARINRRNSRRFAECEVISGTCVVRFAHRVLLLPAAHRLGLIAHEIGHLLLLDAVGDHTEAQADEVAEHVARVRVTYDRRWPGKGLQRGRFTR